eukprot:TRINITY_DN8563_c0_g1_i1.p1 TRINITY_DN8563_c0_g1~~TRINITY_DN8563_c0_g1_i1.p1  ORF type:complete len:138 (-),score=33.81 TRINITY_DN8563_c0_g1_i1:16-429(-)
MDEMLGYVLSTAEKHFKHTISYDWEELPPFDAKTSDSHTIHYAYKMSYDYPSQITDDLVWSFDKRYFQYSYPYPRPYPYPPNPSITTKRFITYFNKYIVELYGETKTIPLGVNDNFDSNMGTVCSFLGLSFIQPNNK